MAKADLPFIDEHCIHIAAPRERTWIALGEVLSKGFGGVGTARIATVLGTQHRSVSGTPLAVGSSIVGFRVTQSQPERRVVLEGEHRFSRYSLTFDLHNKELCATTHAEFPGFRGVAYKTVLLGARGHVLAMRRLLSQIKSRAEGTPGRR
jgi:hypothetical protein